MTDEECLKKYPIRNFLVKVVMFGVVGWFAFSCFNQPKLRDLIPPAQLQQIEQQMQQDQQYQQYQQSELPEMLQPAEAWNEDGGEGGGMGMELDTVKVAQGLDLLFKRDDHLLQRLETLERKMMQMQQMQPPAYQNGMPR
jgi:hypothetical protein